MAKSSPHPLDKRLRVVAAYNQIMAEAVSSNRGYGKRIGVNPFAEVRELAQAYGITPATLRNWVRQLS